MTESSKPAPTGPDQVEREFAENLRQAAYVFENEKDGRFRGSILACRTVARFIYQRNGGAELAAPFLHIATAFEDLERGGKPRLFSKKSAPEKERERSPERKHIHVLAAAALEVLLRLSPRGANIWDDDKTKRDSAANRVARHVNKWPGMRAQQVTGLTVIAWRNQERARIRGRQFNTLVEKILAEPSPRRTLDNLLRKGPPGYWKS
jgi:IS5 family transposase